MASYNAVYDDGVLRITRAGNPPLLAIAGDIDEATYGGLVGTLGKFKDGRGEIHVDLAGVEYCDLAGLRAIVRLAAGDGRGHDGRRVVLHTVPPQLKTLLRILGWDSTTGLAMDDPAASPTPARRTVDAVSQNPD
jgi:ABC-type transporter Mla MlaB component